MATKKATKTVKPARKAADTGSASAARPISLRGQQFTGTVVSAKANKTVTVAWEWRHPVPKYERFERRRSKVAAHNPDEIGAREGDVVRIRESRPISKTKHFVVTEVLRRAER